MNIKVVIIDDEASNRENLRNLLAAYCSNVEIVGEADSALTGIDVIKKSKPDLIFLDIEMPYGNGFDLLEKVKDIHFEIIFITAYNQYAIKAIKFCALDYILKPIDIGELKLAVDKAEKKIAGKEYNQKLEVFIQNIGNHQSNKKIILPSADKLLYIPVNQIIRCEADNNYSTFILESQERILISKTLKEYEELLSEFNFLRVHQSHLVNLNHVKTYVKSDGGYLIMSDNCRVDISRQKKELVMKRLSSL